MPVTNEEILNILTNQVVLLIGIPAALIIFYLQKKLAKVFEDREKKDKMHTWINFLFDNDKNIRESFLKFKQIEASDKNYKSFLPFIGFLLGYFGFILLLLFMSIVDPYARTYCA